MNPLSLFLEPPGPLLTHLHTVYMAYSERLPTRLNPLAERTCFSQVRGAGADLAAFEYVKSQKQFMKSMRVMAAGGAKGPDAAGALMKEGMNMFKQMKDRCPRPPPCATRAQLGLPAS